MLIVRLWVYPGRGAVYLQRATIENFRQPRTHVHLWRWHHAIWFDWSNLKLKFQTKITEKIKK